MLVIGAGLSGASVARDCAMRRLSVVVIEKEDIGAGWTDILPGLLFPDLSLLSTDRDSLHQLCSEVGVLLRTAPNLMEPIPVLHPISKNIPFAERLRLKSKFANYDRFRSWKDTHPHTELDSTHIPLLDAALNPNLHSIMAWDEWRVDQNRLCSRILKGAESCGAVIAKGCTAEKLQTHNRRIAGAWVKTPEGTKLVRARAVVNCAGKDAKTFFPAQSVLSKGKYRGGLSAVWERRLGSYAFFPDALKQGNESFLPVGLHQWFGVHQFDLPSAQISTENRESIFRRVVENLSPFYPSLSRHRLLEVRTAISWHPALENETFVWHHGTEKVEGLFSILPHPSIRYRLVAECATDLICNLLRHREECRTHLELLPGCVSEFVPGDFAALNKNWDSLSVLRLIRKYGHHAAAILRSTAENPQLSSLVCDCEQVSAAELIHCKEQEWVHTAEDALRRTGAGRGNCAGCRCKPWVDLLLGEQVKNPALEPPIRASQMASYEYSSLMSNFGVSHE